MINNRQSPLLILIYTGVVIIASLITFLIVDISRDMLAGLLLAYVFTVLKLFLIERIIINAIKKAPEKAGSYVKLHYFFRFLLTFLILFIAFVDSSINAYVVAVVFLLLKPAAYIYGFVIKDKSSDYVIVEIEDDDYDEFGDF